MVVSQVWYGWLQHPQTGIASGSYLTASQIQALLLLNDTRYDFQRWHGTLLIIAVATVAIILNIFLAKQLPRLEVLMLVLHVVGFLAIVLVLWVLAPRTPAKVVFTEFQNNGNWPNLGLSVLIGLTGPVYSMIASDCAVHMGDIKSALSSPTGQPYIQVLFNATGSHVGTTVLIVLVMTMTLCNTINNVAAASRQLYAFARDQGLPFSSFVKPSRAIPLNAILVCFLTTCLMSLINIGSTVAFNAIVSLGAAGLFSTYLISISCILVKRWRGEPLRPRRWSLGAWGAAVNVAAVLSLLLFYFFSFWPLATPVEGETMNWSITIYGAVVAFALVYYAGFAKFRYEGPVVNIKRDL
ncbi:MAG: hypothetical protein Q9219_006880 [cf. Caloplaca sp. 3 TL-2023]